jgi:anti-sigma regulatory factor (Ser/Thr protein kinase)
MACIPAHEFSFLVEETASMDNWDVFIEKAYLAIHKALKDETKIYKLKLAYEELISNIIKAANELESGREINLKVSCSTSKNQNIDVFTLQTEDNGKEFDPGFDKESDVDVDQHINDRPIGGLGVFLIKQSVDMASYEWIDGINKNQLSMQIE